MFVPTPASAPARKSNEAQTKTEAHADILTVRRGQRQQGGKHV